jgi:hypothetical protein
MAPLEVERRRRRRRQRKDRKEAMGARSIRDLPDNLLRWMILLRLDCSLWLIRAACVCKRWRRVVTDGGDEGRAFLSLASSLHPPTVLGQYHEHTRFVPSSSSPIDGSRFSVNDFHDKYPSVADCHGGLVLLRTRYGPCPCDVPNLVVYEPLTRKRRWLSRLRPPNKQVFLYDIRDVFLLDGNDGHISISNFRVLYQLYTAAAANPQACVFSSANGGEWDFSIDVNTMELRRVLPEETYRQTRKIFTYTLSWPLLRPCP